METGQLPSPRVGLKAALVDNTIFVTGGVDTYAFDHDYASPITSILSWDPSSESWHPAGDLAVPRFYYAALAVPSSIIESECSDSIK